MGFLHYVRRYSLRDMDDFLRNEKRTPEGCGEGLEGKTAVITGATSGIGLETARLLARKGADLVLCNRSAEKSRRLEDELRGAYGCQVRTIIADFSSLSQTKACARSLLEFDRPLDILIWNSGVYYTKRTFTEDGIEMVFQVNHLSSFCITYLLRERLKRENRARIILVNSEGHRFALSGVRLDDLDWKRRRYTGLKSYGAAKTAQLLAMRGFADYFAGTAVTVNAMHPGNVRSAIGENNGRLYRFMKRRLVLPSARDPAVSAEALHYLAASTDLAGVNGCFFNLTAQEKPAPHAADPAMVEPVWKKSVELCALP